jgi:membrane protein implicated in regulation of membrane protease activity
MNDRPNAVELLRLRDELDALDALVPEEWGFRVAVAVAFIIGLLLVVGVLGAGFPFAVLAALLGWLVLRERRGRRERLLRQREVIERRIRMIEDSQAD